VMSGAATAVGRAVGAESNHALLQHVVNSVTER
jgi:hypothetical protein